MQEKSYREIDAISQSAIKSFKTNTPDDWRKIWITKEKEQKDSASLRKGSITDLLLFDPDSIDKNYIISDIPPISDSIKYIVDNLFSNIESINIKQRKLIDYTEEIVKIAKSVPMSEGKIGYGQTWKEDTLLSKVNSEGEQYFDFLKLTNGKNVVSNTEYLQALSMAEAAKKSDIVKPYLDPKLNIFQLEIVVNGYKGCLDILHKDDNKKKLRIVDFKTADSAQYFFSNIWKFGYLDQVSFYDNLLKGWLEENSNEKYREYEILPPINIVIDSKYNIPYIYEYSFHDIKCAWDGYMKNHRHVKGIIDYIREINWHLKTNKWEYPMDHYINGCIKLYLINDD